MQPSRPEHDARIVRSLTILFASIVLASGLALSVAPALAEGPFAAGELLIQGSRLTLYADDLTTDADQTIDIGERARVRTCFGGVEEPCGSVLPGDPRVAGLAVRAELRGPEVPDGLPLETLPGGTFVLPGLQQEGEYRLENIRLVDAATGQVLGAAEPSVAFLHVREIVLTSASVRTLSLAELQARGITFNEENFQAFDFAVGFAFGSEVVEIELPIVYNGFEPVQPLREPEVVLEGLPEDVVKMVRRWQPPKIIPFVLEQEEPDGPRLEEEKDVDLTFPIFGAIVMPGSVSYLNQFFEARLIVANGAPIGTDVSLADLGASIRLPAGNVLRVVESDPSVAAGQRVPVVDGTGGRILTPGEQGSAAWTVEGLVAGTHTLAIDVTGQIERPGRDPLPVLSRTQAAVEVVDARFNLTFSHPDVVREGEAYSLFVTVTNLSRATQNLVTVDLDEATLTGVHGEDPDDPLRRTIETLEPGQAETLEYRLVAELDGKVVATTFQSDSAAGQGTIVLRTGVGELGIPLSPATLVLPRFSERLDVPYLPTGDFFRANVRFLGLAHSLAVAPSAQVPAGLPHVIRSDVERRAVDLGQVGHRIFLGEPVLEALEILALDQLGNREPLAEIDALRRALTKGEAVAAEAAALFRGEQDARNLGAVALLDHLAETASYTDPWLGAVVVPDGSGPGPVLTVRRQAVDGTGVLAGVAGAGETVRTLPFGEVYGVSEVAGGGETVPLALVGHVESAEVFEISLVNDGPSAVAGRLVVVLPDDGDPRDFRRLDFGRVEVAAGSSVTVSVGMELPSPGGASTRRVARPPFRVVGAAQDFRLNESGPDPLGNIYRPNRYGNGIVYLFNRPPDDAVLDPEAFRIRSSFDGLDTAGQPAAGVSEKVGTAAFVQDDPRVVAVRYSTPVSALVDPSTGGPLVDHEQTLLTSALVDAWGERVDPNAPAPRLETSPLHVGGLVDGRVVRGTGEPAAGTLVQLIRIWLKQTALGVKPIPELLGGVTTGADGRFFFDFVESPHWDPQVTEQYVLRATVPEGDDPELEPATVEQVSSRIRLQNRLAHVNIALLGRGVVTGTLVYQDDGSPVPGGTVSATSTLFNEQGRAETAADGSFRIGGVPVGPITLTGRDGDGRSGYATVGVESSGDTVAVRLEIPRAPPELGTVTGRVVRFPDGGPVAGAAVALSSNGHPVSQETTDAFGRFRFDEVPAGQVTLQAAAWAISRSSVVSSLLLAPGATEEVTLELSDGGGRTVIGRVVFHDPITGVDEPVEGAVAFIKGPGVFAYTDASGRYRLEGVPVQGVNDSPYAVEVIDYERGLQGRVPLPRIVDSTPDPVEAQRVVLERMSGGVDGVVLDPLGRPMGGVEVHLYPLTTTSRPDGSFSFDDIPVGEHRVVAHVEDGLQPGREGYFGQLETQVVYGGHRPFVRLRMVGSGVVTIHTTTATSTGVLTPIYYKPTWFHGGSWQIKLKGAHIETSTDPNGNLELRLPVGAYEIVAYNPFHGIETVRGSVDFAGQTRHHEIVFEDAATVAGQVVDVDGTTPVPGIEVTLEAEGLLPQTQQSDAQGRFRFELVPKGSVIVTARGVVGTVERVGRTLSLVGLGGQELELQVELKAQGSVRGRVVESFNGELQPLPFAQYAVRENAWPYRRLPADGTWFLTDADGRYEVSHLYAGDVTVIARDSGQVLRSGTARGTIEVDWEVVDLPDVVLSTSVGFLEVVVRDPETGAPVPDAQVRLSNGEWTVADGNGVVAFDALVLGTYSLYAFHAPTGRSGRVDGLVLDSPGERVTGTVYLDQRGEVRGTLYDDLSRTVGVPGGIVELRGRTAGGFFRALANTANGAGEEGRFSFLGIPEGRFTLEAAVQTSARRARAEATLTETSPVADVAMVLEPVHTSYVRLFERLTSGLAPVDPASGLFSVRFVQDGYDFTRSAPEAGTDVYLFPDLLSSRPATLSAQEGSGEWRSASVRFGSFEPPFPIGGSGSQADPFQLVLQPRGAVRVSVVDPGGVPVVGAEVTLRAGSEQFPSVTGADGRVSFSGVPAGTLRVSATSPDTGTGGTTTGTLTYDDEVLELSVQLAPAVAAHGAIYLPVDDDRYAGDPSSLVPAPDVIVEIRDAEGATQATVTGADGGYRFEVLPIGGYTLTARDASGDRFASMVGSVTGPDGFDNPLPGLILDASPPRIVSIVPPPGLEGVSRTAAVEIVFSEPLHPDVLPTGQATSQYFGLASASGVPAEGLWTSAVDPQGFQLVRFTPSSPYENFATYRLTIRGGDSGVRDRIGRPLTSSGDVGSNFKTSDGIGPEVVSTTPSLDLPVEPGVPIRFDFNEAVSGADELFDGDGVGDAVTLYGLRDTGDEVRLPLTLYLTRSGYSVQVEVAGGVTLSGDTLRRRVVVSGLADAYGNPMPVYERSFRLYDANPPVVDAVPYPDGAPEGQLVQGVDYLLVPAISNLDEVTPEQPGGDLARVDYYFEDPTDPARPVAPSHSATEFPFTYAFKGAYSGNGVDPQPFPVWVQAVDTSTNRSNVVQVAMEVLPNSPPTVGAVAFEALAPVAGTFYAGSTVRATVSGLDDPDGSRLTLSAELYAEGNPEPIADAPDRGLDRPASGSWTDLPPETFDFELPLDLAEGTPVYVVGRVTDSRGAGGAAESERVPVADDATEAAVDSLAAVLETGGPETVFFIGESFYVELRARDGETAVDTVQVTVDRTDLFPEPLTVTPVAGEPDRYRTSTLTVPVDLVTGEIPVEATVEVRDVGGNLATATLAFTVAPEPDPTAPVARWITPWAGASWPADYTSVVQPAGTALLLRAEASDLTDDGSGNLLPGNVVSVRFRGPVHNADTGALELGAEPVEAELVPGTDGPGRGTYQALWQVPDGVPAGTELPFEVRVADGGGTVTVEQVRVVAAPPRRVYEGTVAAVAPTDAMLATDGDPAGGVFLLDGATVSLRPQEDGSVRRLPAVHLYAGGVLDAGVLSVHPSVLTAPEITTYDSAVLFQPLELAVDASLSVGAGSAIDLSGRGLLGSTPTRELVLPGETGAEPWAGGSHGGRGGHGSPSGGWDRVDLAAPGTVYDSLREPYLPGGGGASFDESPGGAGGGVARILADGATVRLEGDLLADGRDGRGGGGAGGAVLLVAGRLEGGGRISATGGAGSSGRRAGGGGGGRISVSYRELGAGVDLAAQLDASGGSNDWQTPSAAERRGGAGTIYVEQLDGAGVPVAPGAVRVANPEGLVPAVTPLPALGDGEVASVDSADPAGGTVHLDVARVQGDLTGELLVLQAGDGSLLGVLPIVGQERVADPTAADGFHVRLRVEDGGGALDAVAAELSAGAPVRFHGRSRLETVAAVGAARLVAEDDLLLGPADDPAPALNDRARIGLTGSARALLRAETPTVTVTGTPAAGTELLLGETVEVSWQADDPLGLATTATTWSLDGTTTSSRHDGEPLGVSGGPVTLEVPHDTPAGEVSYTVEATDLAGRSARAEAVWTVLPNEAPAATVALADGATTPAPAGYLLPVVVRASDREGLAAVTLLASGPVTPESQRLEVTGGAAELMFEVEVLASADGAEPVVLQAVAEDLGGASTPSDPLSVPVAANAPPTGSLALASGAAPRVKPGESTTVTVQASDADGLATIELQVAGAATEPVQTRTATGTAVEETFIVTAAADAPLDSLLTATAVITDSLGASVTTAPLDIPVVGDSDPPVVTISLDPEAARYTAGDVVTVTASATDDAAVSSLTLTVDGETQTSDGTDLVYTWLVPPVSEASVFAVTAEATDPTGNVGTASREVTVDPLADDVAPEIAFTCPTTGAVLPTGFEMTLSAHASDDLGVAWVDFYVAGAAEPFARVTPEAGTATGFDATATFTLPATVGETGLRAEVVDSGNNRSQAEIVVRTVGTVDLQPDGAGTNDWTALSGQVAVLRSGTVSLDRPVALGGLIVLPGATVTRADGLLPEPPLDLQVSGPVYVACGGGIDATGFGYPADTSYPGHTVAQEVYSGGSHIGRGGVANGPAPETFGSVYRPREAGGGGRSDGVGGGVVRIVADRFQVDGAVRANGVGWDRGQIRGGAGGSVWITAATVAGAGTVEARGGLSRYSNYGQGGGGAVAVEYETVEAGATLLESLHATTGTYGRNGGAGSVYLRGPSSVFGDLVLDNGSLEGVTELPALGAGVAQAGSGGSILVTALGAIPEYFVGHWVEIYDGATGGLRGTARVAGIDSGTITLDGGVSVAEGDLWQGVYRFDSLRMTDGVALLSDDPVRIAGEQVISSGVVRTNRIDAERLRVADGAVLTQLNPLEPLTLEAGELVVEGGGAIDVTGLGYGGDATYPGHQPAQEVYSGGSHIGEGGINNGPAPETFGSVYRPQEAGGGGRSDGVGGGVVRIVADRLQIDGAIRANGLGWESGQIRGGAGGSVWIEAGTITGIGTVEARGGRSRYSNYGQGGGGAIAVEYQAVEAGSTVLQSLHATTGTYGLGGGAGSVYLRGPGGTYGDLLLANDEVDGITRLPALGSGVAQAGSSGTLLVTELVEPIPAYFVGHWVEVYDGSTGNLEATARIVSIEGTAVRLEGGASVAPGDWWQGIYRFDRVEMQGGVSLSSDDPIRTLEEQVIASGTVRTDRIEAAKLRIGAGAVLTHWATNDPTQPESLTVDVTELVVDASGAIDVSGLGYRAGTTYPGHGLSGAHGGGSHIGESGTAAGETFGSVYRPLEAGGGGRSVGAGGGVVRIEAGRLQVDGAIRANGFGWDQGLSEGAGGGSVWITTGALAGTGTIEADGGRARYSSYGHGGGGAVALEYDSLEVGSTLLGSIHARTPGVTGETGGAGSVYLRGPGAVYGDLVVDNGGTEGSTVLPALGAGVAQAGSGGAVLVTDLVVPVAPYFVGHWVEVYHGATGALLGSTRVVAIDGAALILDGAVTVSEGDLWQGVYRFDGVRLTGGVTLVSEDPVRVMGEQVIASGTVRTDRIEADRLRIASGAVLTHPATTDAARPESLTLELGELVIEAGAAIDVSGVGFQPGVTFPGHGLPGNHSGGSHVGQGGISSAPAADTFGSLQRPQEPGGGARYQGPGGGVVRIEADRVQVDGGIRANGLGWDEGEVEGGAGGSIWITTGVLAGSGTIEADGGRARYTSYGQGGGGAIAVEYGAVEAGSTVLGSIHATTTGTDSRTGGAGSVYLRGPGAVHGDLVVDNGGTEGTTVLPALGAGVAQPGSGGTVLVTDLAVPIAPYFVGHWVEVVDGTTGALRGQTRVVAIEGAILTLDGTVSVSEGDLWQGVYRFDTLTLTGGVTLESADPIRTAGQVLVTDGVVVTRAVRAGSLRVAPGASLTHPPTTDPLDPQSLSIEVGELVVEADGAIDVSGAGYRPNMTFSGHGLPGNHSGGSHVGQGGISSSPAAETFGSVQRPREPGGGARYQGPGGGVVRIEADRVQVDGGIRANGLGWDEGEVEGGAGGSIWITTGSLAGLGTIEADGGRARYTSYGQGGGGAIAVEHGGVEAGSTVLDTVRARTTGTDSRTGGAGSILLLGPDSTYGDLVVDNGGVAGITELPSLGSGVAQAGTAGAVVVTDRATPIPEYFVGHWVTVETPSRVVKGTWRIGAVDGATFTLVPNDTETIAVDEGDEWSGLYRFDSVTVTGGATLQSVDPVVEVVGGASFAFSSASATGQL